MKHLKKFVVCLLSLTILCSSPLTYVSAATGAENEMVGTLRHITNILVEKDGAKVRFYFDYSDGNSAKLAAAISENSDYDLKTPPESSFIGDTCYASAVVTHISTGKKVTLRAWCDIYGDLGTY